MTSASPEQLLAGAAMAIQRPDAGWRGQWPRAAAILARQALEAGVDRMWTGPAAGMAAASMKAQMVCLPAFLSDPVLARDTYVTWCALSNACHAHPYDLSPTVAELKRWNDVVGRLLLATPPRPG
jgi:hypothetical protein